MAATPRPRASLRHADGTRLAYDVTGSGPAILLLHGGGQTRRSWHDLGYVKRLATEFTVVTMDLRGHGESGKPEDTRAYAIDRLIEDVLAVADAAQAPRFAIWGFSVRRERRPVRCRALEARPVDGVHRHSVRCGGRRHFQDVHRRHAVEMDACCGSAPQGTARRAIVVGSRSRDMAAWYVPVSLAWLGAMLDYPPVEPSDMPCPTLWLVGTSNQAAMPSVAAYKPKLGGTRVSLALLEGLTHPQEIERIDQTLPRALEFTRGHR